MYRITEELGGRTVEEYESVMSLNEFHCWKEYYDMKEEERRRKKRKAKQAKKRPGRIKPRGRR